jgi:hypothetical protein
MARPTEVGAYTLVFRASVGRGGHGQYISDREIIAIAGLTKGKDGTVLQRQV